MQTILVFNDNEHLFEESVNEALEVLSSKDKEVIDIKFSTHGALWGDTEHQNSMFSALILYKN